MTTMAWIRARCKEDGDCLLWTLSCTPGGQPKYPFREDGRRKNRQIRRVAWELTRGPIPAGMLVTVTCDHPTCLEHLALTTKADVIRRMSARPDVALRKFLGGVRASRHRGKLDMEKARYIRGSDKTLHALAGELGVSVTLVHLVRRGERWRELTAGPFAGLGART